MITRDIEVSGSLSLLLASLAFVVMFHRARALAAVLPPLVVGTVWTTGLVAIFMPQLSAISIGFMAVVVGVGVDTGVHVYAALLEARRQGLSPHEAALSARAHTARPTLLAAIAAGTAFASLALSDLERPAPARAPLRARRGAHGDRHPPHDARSREPCSSAVSPPLRSDRGGSAQSRGRRGRDRGRGSSWGSPSSPCWQSSSWGGQSRGARSWRCDRTTSRRSSVQDEIYSLFGGERGQWVVLAVDADPERAVERGDHIAEALDRSRRRRIDRELRRPHELRPLPRQSSASAYGSATRSISPRGPRVSPQRSRRAASTSKPARPPSKRSATRLRASPRSSIRQGSSAGSPLVTARSTRTIPSSPSMCVRKGTRPWTRERSPRSRRRTPARSSPATRTSRWLSSGASRTTSRASPSARLILVAIALRAALGRAGDVVLAILTVVVELGIVAVLMRSSICGGTSTTRSSYPSSSGSPSTRRCSSFTPRARRKAGEDPIAHTLEAQGPLVASTALTTAAGFVALLACHFDGLYDLGAVGALGSVAGLLCALFLVPAGLRLTRTVVR